MEIVEEEGTLIVGGARPTAARTGLCTDSREA